MAKKQPFSAELLVATRWDTAEQKARFGNDLARFVTAGFPLAKFTKSLYKRLSLTFGHIAHTSLDGFFGVWFNNSRRQMEWVRYILEHVPCGDPTFTYSDLERQFKSWLAVNKANIEQVILGNLQREEDAGKAERARLAEVKGKRYQEFKIVAMSSNTNAFGHHQFVMLARDGSVYAVHHIQSNGAWHKDQVFNVRLDERGNPTWEGMNVECPDRKENAPANIVAKFWNGEAA